ncbi:MAG: hypothetical protein ACOX1S_03265 [Anaerostipes sp.]
MIKLRKLIISGCVWSFVIIFFWNTLYGKTFHEIKNENDLFDYTSSSVGLQTPFLVASSFLLIYLLLLIFHLNGKQLYSLYREGRKGYIKSVQAMNIIFSLFFVAIFGLTYTICLSSISSIIFFIQNGYFIKLILYIIALASFYALFGELFFCINCVIEGRWKAIIVTIIIAICVLCLFYYTDCPTPFQSLDVFDMSYYRNGILVFTYARRVLFNIVLIFLLQVIAEELFLRKDVIMNEVL